MDRPVLSQCYPVSNCSALWSFLVFLGDELECMRPSVYRNVARQLNISVAMETTVSDAFVAVATEIFSAGEQLQGEG